MDTFIPILVLVITYNPLTQILETFFVKMVLAAEI